MYYQHRRVILAKRINLGFLAILPPRQIAVRDQAGIEEEDRRIFKCADKPTLNGLESRW